MKLKVEGRTLKDFQPARIMRSHQEINRTCTIVPSGSISSFQLSTFIVQLIAFNFQLSTFNFLEISK